MFSIFKLMKAYVEVPYNVNQINLQIIIFGKRVSTKVYYSTLLHTTVVYHTYSMSSNITMSPTTFTIISTIQ